MEEKQRQQMRKIELSDKKLSREEKRRQQRREFKSRSSKARKLRHERIKEDIRRLKTGAPGIYPPHQYFTRLRGPHMEAETGQDDMDGSGDIKNEDA